MIPILILCAPPHVPLSVHRSLTAWAPELLEPARRRLDALETRFRNLRRRYGLPEENAPPDLDRATRRQLQALGYVR